MTVVVTKPFLNVLNDCKPFDINQHLWPSVDKSKSKFECYLAQMNCSYPLTCISLPVSFARTNDRPSSIQ